LRRAEPWLVVASAASSLAILFLFLPLAALFTMFDPRIFAKVFLYNPVFYRVARAAMLTTFEASGLAVALNACLGIPLAYILARKRFRGRGVIESLVDVPLLLPHTVAGIAVLCAFGHAGLLAPITKPLGIYIEDTFLGIVLAMAFVSAPIMIDTAKVGFASVDPELEMVARSLGASPSRVFASITLPLAIRSIAAGAILSWARALSEVGAILIVAYYPRTLNVLTIEWFSMYGLPYCIALAVPLALVSIALFTLLRLVIQRAHD